MAPFDRKATLSLLAMLMTLYLGCIGFEAQLILVFVDVISACSFFIIVLPNNVRFGCVLALRMIG